MNRRDLLALGLAFVSARALTPRSALAQGKYPERPIKLMVAFSAGGVNDVVARQWAERVKTLLGTFISRTKAAAPARSPPVRSRVPPATATRSCSAAPAPWCSTR